MNRAKRALCALAVASATAVLAPGAGAADGVLEFLPRDAVEWGTAAGGPEAPVPGTTYTVYTGVASTAGAGLIEPTAPPVRDDVVTFDLLGEMINDYIASAGGVNRSVTESLIVNGDGTETMTILITGQTPAGGPGDLFPSGFTVGGAAATGGAFGLGINLPDALDNAPGGDPMNFVLSDIVSGNVRISTGGTFGAPIAIPASLFTGVAGQTYPVSNWDGIFGIAVIGNLAASTGGAQDRVEINVTFQPIPEPGALASIGLASLALLRRRTR